MQTPKPKVGLKQEVKPIKEIVSIATAIFNECHEIAKSNPQAQYDEVNKLIIDKHREFANTFPVVLRFIVAKSYSAEVFEQWLIQRSKLEIKTEEDYLSLQGDYLTGLFKHYNKLASMKEVAEYSKRVKADLLAEHKAFINNIKKIQDEEKAKSAGRHDELRNNLTKRIMTLSEAEKNSLLENVDKKDAKLCLDVEDTTRGSK